MNKLKLRFILLLSLSIFSHWALSSDVKIETDNDSTTDKINKEKNTDTSSSSLNDTLIF